MVHVGPVRVNPARQMRETELRDPIERRRWNGLPVRIREIGNVALAGVRGGFEQDQRGDVLRIRLRFRNEEHQVEQRYRLGHGRAPFGKRQNKVHHRPRSGEAPPQREGGHAFMTASHEMMLSA